MSTTKEWMRNLYYRDRARHKKLSSIGRSTSARNRRRLSILKQIREEDLQKEIQEIQKSTNEDICPID